MSNLRHMIPSNPNLARPSHAALKHALIYICSSTTLRPQLVQAGTALVLPNYAKMCQKLDTRAGRAKPGCPHAARRSGMTNPVLACATIFLAAALQDALGNKQLPMPRGNICPLSPSPISSSFSPLPLHTQGGKSLEGVFYFSLPLSLNQIHANRHNTCTVPGTQEEEERAASSSKGATRTVCDFTNMHSSQSI